MNFNLAVIFFFLIIFTLIQNTKNYIVLPFKTTNIPFQDLNSDSAIENFLSQIDINQPYTTLSFGNPSKNVDVYLSMKNLAFSISSNNCLKDSYSSYDPSLSNTFKNETPYTYSIGDIKQVCIANEQCLFYNNLNLAQNIILDNFKFYLGNNTSPKSDNISPNKFCGIVGLMRYSSNSQLYDYNLVNYLKKIGKINSYSWGIFYFDKENSYNVDKDIISKYDGYLIVGITNDTYLNFFKTDNIYSIYGYNSFFWSLHFNKIYFNVSDNENVCSENTRIEFVIDMNYITSDGTYYKGIKKHFFQKYFEKNICLEEKMYNANEKGYNYMIICNSEFKSSISSFPNIYFYNERFPYVFNLDYTDVFMEYNNKIYFLIIFKEDMNTLWRLGKIFMKKYPFIFDYDKKTVSFVHLKKYGGGQSNNESDKTKENKSGIFANIKIYIIIILLIIAVIIGIFIGKYIWDKQRKKRANELDDDNYEYVDDLNINR